jgi:hypothetical protein
MKLRSASRPLPQQLVSLVHHIQLHEAGWWDQALAKLVLAAIWLADESLLNVQVADEIDKRFRVKVEQQAVTQHIESLVEGGTLVYLPGAKLKIVESELRELEKHAQNTAETEGRARELFTNLMEACPELDATETWKSVNDKVLLPMICTIGARTYDLLSGSKLDIERVTTLHQFLKAVPEKHRVCIRGVIEKFLNPQNADVRAYIFGHLNAYFVVEASQLGDESIRALNASLGKKPTFTAFTDTNFVFSLLGLHDDEQNEAAQSLLALAKDLEDKVAVEFYILPPTVDEARAALEVEIGQLADLKFTPNLASAALNAPDLPNGARVLASASLKAGRPLSAKDFLTPYVTNTVRLLRDRGVELYNQNFTSYENNPGVLADVKRQVDLADDKGRKKKGTKAKAKTETQIKHDTVLWHFVRDKRPKRIDSPLDAGYWILTEDFRFIGFDNYKGTGKPGYIGACIHPLTLLQMLQFWVPRSTELEVALISNLRLAMRDFDRQAEQVTVRILQNLSQYEDAHVLPYDTVTSLLMNQVVRQKMKTYPTVDRDQAFIRDALLEEHTRVAEELGKTLADLNRVSSEKNVSDATVTDLKTRLKKLEDEKGNAETSLRALSDKIRDVEAAKTLGVHRTAEVQLFVENWLVIPLGLVAAVTATVFIVGALLHRWGWRLTTFVLLCELLIWPIIVDQVGSRSPTVSSSGLFQKFKGARKWLYALLGALILGVAEKTIADVISKLAEDRLRPDTSHVQSSPSSALPRNPNR